MTTRTPKLPAHSGPSGPTSGSSGFSGFSDEALGFFSGLEADNSRTYWTDHGSTYQREVRGPMLAMLALLEPEFGPATVFRPHRDVRFSADKSPYKTHIGAVVRGDGDREQPWAGVGTLYVQLSASGLLAGGGQYHLSRDQLARYRAGVAAERPGRELAAITRRLQQDGLTLGGATLLRAPRGVDPAHPRIDLLRHKALVGMCDFAVPDWLATERCSAEVASVWRKVAPLDDWLTRNVGPDDPSLNP